MQIKCNPCRLFYKYSYCESLLQKWINETRVENPLCIVAFDVLYLSSSFLIVAVASQNKHLFFAYFYFVFLC